MAASFSAQLFNFLTSMAAFVIVSSIALGLRWLAFRTLKSWAQRTITQIDDLVLENLRLPSIILCLLLGLYAGIYGAQELSPYVSRIALNITYALSVLTVTAAVANFAEASISLTLKQKNLDFRTQGLSVSVLKVAVWIIGCLVLLSGLGVSITPMITALGIGGLAISLALKIHCQTFLPGCIY